ncbi:polysaccharide pyruvyl transferase CsaB [Sedimentibacter sp. zth1]|uniref:polysaccharide pyruvyl transferase CsaB n=1 Tax=Sedimentibacter sp. zth1 TaxID=2816908 RepID=UPI001A90F2A4|nr:polysaccharide pyruvyl transferase CsaB [Sedimentibacter sp. zth1]QSX06127.1 polysaccharide pyruvyl transferase CsaB [Sedimentibacter sp. zth1]
MKNILLAGYYGFGNLGDEAILEMFLELFKNSKNIDKVTVLSGNATETKDKYNVNAIGRYDIASVFSNLLKSDVLVFGGGSLLQDVTSKRSIYYYLSLIVLAKMLRKKVILLSQGIGPIHESNFKNVGRVLKKADIITVRDYKSIEILESMNVKKERIKFSADPVIDLCSESKIFKTSGKKKVCFSLRNWKDLDLKNDVCNVVERLYKNDIECTFICFHHNIDSKLLEELEEILGEKAIFIKNRLSTKNVLDIIKNMDVLVGVRLHALILAASAFVPFIALSYDPKIDEFLKCLDLESFTDMNHVNSIDSDALYGEIINKINNKDEEQLKLEKSVNELRKTLDVNVKIIEDI